MIAHKLPEDVRPCLILCKLADLPDINDYDKAGWRGSKVDNIQDLGKSKMILTFIRPEKATVKEGERER